MWRSRHVALGLFLHQIDIDQSIHLQTSSPQPEGQPSSLGPGQWCCCWDLLASADWDNPLQPLDPACFPSPRARPNKTRCSSFNALHLTPPSPPAVAATNSFPAALCPRLIHPAPPALQLRRDAAARCFCIASHRLASHRIASARLKPLPSASLSLSRTEICLCIARLATPP